MKPASAYCFNTRRARDGSAEKLPDDVPQDLKEERLSRLNAVVDRLTDDALKAKPDAQSKF